MAVSHEIKSQLAKLLATEDLVVEHKKVETACFNVHTRVLTLPMWERASGGVYDMLVGHEVGHALYTPDRNWILELKIPPQFVNVVEDVRIEKLMKRRYAGISKTFYRGYAELADEDFFQIAGEDISKMNLADKANLHFKIGNFVEVPFEDDERELCQKIADTETFDDVLKVSKELYEFCKKQEEMKTKMDDLQMQGGQGTGSDIQEMPQQESEGWEDGNNGETAEEKSDSWESDNPEESDSYGGTDNSDEPEVSTMNNLEEAIKELAKNDGMENVYVELPKLDINKFVVDNSEVHERFDEWTEWMKNNDLDEERVFSFIDGEFIKFKRSAQKEVNYLVKEFECKKAADSYARATTARTGVLDCSKLHTYKYNEDLFQKVTTLADGKNHGLIFVLDWSGSMNSVLQDTLKQLFNLMWFCKKVNIPFEVYAFTNEYPKMVRDEDGSPQMKGYAYKKREGLVVVNEWFSMMNIFTSKTKMKVLEQQMKNLFRLAWTFNHWANLPIPTGLNLSGTPLNEAFISLHQLIPHFKQENKIQKVQCVVLSDGEAGGMKYHKEVQRRWEIEPFLGVGAIGHNAFLRNRQNGKTYSMDCEWWEMTDIFIRNLRDSFPESNFIGIRILESRDANSFIRRYCGWVAEKTEKVIKTWKKERAFALYESGYHTYFAISANSLANETEFDVDEGATKAKIKSAFVKSLKNKKMNKKVLGEFVELIA